MCEVTTANDCKCYFVTKGVLGNAIAAKNYHCRVTSGIPVSVNVCAERTAGSCVPLVTSLTQSTPATVSPSITELSLLSLSSSLVSS